MRTDVDTATLANIGPIHGAAKPNVNPVATTTPVIRIAAEKTAHRGALVRIPKAIPALTASAPVKTYTRVSLRSVMLVTFL